MSRIRLELDNSYIDALSRIDDKLHSELNLRATPGRRHRWIAYPILSDDFFLITLGMELEPYDYVDIYDIDVSHEGGVR